MKPDDNMFQNIGKLRTAFSVPNPKTIGFMVVGIHVYVYIGNIKLVNSADILHFLYIHVLHYPYVYMYILNYGRIRQRRIVMSVISLKGQELMFPRFTFQTLVLNGAFLIFKKS